MTIQMHRPSLVRRTDDSVPTLEAPPSHGRSAVLWWAAAAGLFFLVPFVGTDRLGLQPDLYYLGYFTIAVAFFAAFVLSHAAALRPLWTANLWQSLLVGALAGAALAVGLFNQTGTPHDEGWRYGFEIVWRGLVYGAVDAITLFVLPAAAAYLVLRGNRLGLKRKAAFAGLALAMSLIVTTTYHLGYSEYRDSTLKYPEIGAVVANVPTALTGNPLGAVVTHATMHVSSVVHQNEGGAQHMIPPRVTADYPSHGDSDLGAGLAAGWLVVAAGVLVLLVRRQRTR